MVNMYVEEVRCRRFNCGAVYTHLLVVEVVARGAHEERHRSARVVREQLVDGVQVEPFGLQVQEVRHVVCNCVV